MFTKDQWHEVDTDGLTGTAAKAFKAYTSASEALKVQREVLEDVWTDALSDQIPETLEIRFAYRWGKVSVSAVEPRARSKNGGKIKL